MSARSVSRLWTNGGQYTAAAQATGDYPGTTGYIVDARPTTMTAGESTDTFSDSVGPSLTMPTAATATQFIVIEKPLCSIIAQGRVKPIVNTTAYNVNPDGHQHSLVCLIHSQMVQKIMMPQGLQLGIQDSMFILWLN